MRRSSLLLLLGLPAAATPALAQAVTFGAARWLSSPHVSEYKVGLAGISRGPFHFGGTVQYVTRSGESRASWAGIGGDAMLRTTALAQPYILAGGALGVGRSDSGGGYGPGIGAWGGVGAELLTLGGVGLQAEALYTWRSRMGVSGVSLGLRLGTRLGRRNAIEPLPPAVLPRSAAADEATIKNAVAPPPPSPAADVVVTAVSAMGSPYKWGGSDGDGFDCSGLIQYAYSQHGWTLPRTSAEQAGAGSPVERSVAQLMPGDILTFSAEPGEGVSHVGLYIGNGRFIHSATHGVQISVLAETDPAGRWWLDRWVGARRVM